MINNKNNNNNNNNNNSNNTWLIILLNPQEFRRLHGAKFKGAFHR